MNRKEFFLKLIELFPKFFDLDKEMEKSNAWMKAYKEVLPENWDYEKLYKTMIREYTSTYNPPSPAWFNEKRIKIKSEEDRDNENFTRHRNTNNDKAFINSDEFPKEISEFEKARKETKQFNKKLCDELERKLQIYFETRSNSIKKSF